jgi:hypothetical protein
MLTVNSRSSYEGFWDASKRQAAENAARNKSPVAAKASPPSATHTEHEPSRTDILNVLAKKTTKDVRNWFREQIEGLDDSSSD